MFCPIMHLNTFQTFGPCSFQFGLASQFSEKSHLDYNVPAESFQSSPSPFLTRIYFRQGIFRRGYWRYSSQIRFSNACRCGLRLRPLFKENRFKSSFIGVPTGCRLKLNRITAKSGDETLIELSPAESYSGECPWYRQLCCGLKQFDTGLSV